MFKAIIFLIVIVTLVGINASPISKESAAVNGKCGGGCILSTQCAAWSGNLDCRCTWFTCR